MASTYLTRTQSSGNRKTWTWSAWVKFAYIATGEHDQKLFLAHNNTHPSTQIITNSMRLGIYTYDGATTNFNVTCNRYLRDCSSWYHLVIAVDTTQATASDRVKIYINGVQETSFLSSTYPSQNFDTQVNLSSVIAQVSGGGTPSNAFDGEMAHVHLIDGTAYDASAFGETDAASGIWKPITSPSVTYGTNGFFLKFANSGSLGTDSSGNGNNLTVNGTGTQTLDTPSNVFATMNPLIYNSSPATFSNGNNTVYGSTPNWRQAGGTLAMSAGKYYWEFKAITGSDFNGSVGIKDVYYANIGNLDYPLGYGSLGGHGIAYGKGGELYVNTTPATSSWGSTYTVGDIISVALDLDNHFIYFAKNGTWQNSGVPTSGATGTGGVAVATVSNGENVWLPFVTTHAGGFTANFGNGYFGTTAVASGNADGAGYGIFEYAPPTGYYALCTKNINTYG